MAKLIFNDRSSGENVVKYGDKPELVEYAHYVQVWRTRINSRERFIVRHYGNADRRMDDYSFDRDELLGRNATMASAIRYAVDLLDDYASKVTVPHSYASELT